MCSAVSDSFQPYGLEPARLLCPWWNSPGKNTGVGSLSLLQRIFLSQESDGSLLHCRQTLYWLSYQGSTKSSILPILKNVIQGLYQTTFPPTLSRSALFTKLSSALGTINLLNVCQTELQNHYVSLFSYQRALSPGSVNSFFLPLPTLLLQALTLFLSKILL